MSQHHDKLLVDGSEFRAEPSYYKTDRVHKPMLSMLIEHGRKRKWLGGDHASDRNAALARHNEIKASTHTVLKMKHE